MDLNFFLSFFEIIGFDTHDIENDISNHISYAKKILLSNIKNISLHSSKEDLDYIAEINFLDDKYNFKCMTFESERLNFFILFNETDIFYVRHLNHYLENYHDGGDDNKITKYSDNITIRSLISSGIVSGFDELKLTNNCSPEYAPSLEWLKNSSADSIIELSGKFSNVDHLDSIIHVTERFIFELKKHID